jgi:hypothetical protein
MYNGESSRLRRTDEEITTKSIAAVGCRQREHNQIGSELV